MVNNGNHEGKGFLVYKCTCLALPIVEINTSYVFQGCARACLFSRVQLFATSWTVVHQTLLSMGFPRQEYWNGLPCPPPGDFPDPGIKLSSPALAGGFFTTEPPGKPYVHIYTHICNLYSRLPCPRNRQFCLSCSLQQCQIYRIC